METFKEAIESQTHPYTVAGDEMGSSVVVLVLRLNKYLFHFHATRKET